MEQNHGGCTSSLPFWMATTARTPGSPALGDHVAAQLWQHYRFFAACPCVALTESLLHADSQSLPCWDSAGSRHEAEQASSSSTVGQVLPWDQDNRVVLLIS